MDNSILLCIFNYKEDENARRWYNLLSPHFKTYVLDSGNDKKCDDFIQFPNIYYSGLFNETKKLAAEENYSWVGIICSDVTIDDFNSHLLIDKIKWLKTTSNIGAWQPSLDSNSAERNKKHNANHELESVPFLEGMIIFMKNNLFSKFPSIDTSKNLYGMYIDNVFSAFVIDNQMLNIYDNSVQVHHREESGYDKSGRKDYIEWCNKTKKELLHKEVSLNNKKGLNFKESLHPVIKYCKTYTTDNIEINSSVKNPIIVSFTSWKKRISYLEKFVNNFKNQTVRPDKFILWLSSDEISVKELPSSLLNDNFLEIHWVDKNLKSFKKFLSIQQYPNAYNIILDDDRYYNSHTIETLLQKSKEFNDSCVICYYADICNSKGEPWGENQNDKTEVLWVNDSCVLYPPNVFPQEAFEYFYNIMSTKPLVSDECFLMPFIINKNIKIVTIGGTGNNGLQKLNAYSPMIPNSQGDALHKMFFAPGETDTHKNAKNALIKNIIEELPFKYYVSYKNKFKNFKYDSCKLDLIKKNKELWKICQPAEDKEFIQNFSMEDKIIVSMTSWKKRIDNVSQVIETLLKNEVLPDLIVINLAISEFPNKESDLPDTLVKLISKNKLIEINWLQNNTLVWKKIIPTIIKYPNACIIGIDDDFIYPTDFIKTFKSAHELKKNIGLAGNKDILSGYKAHCGCASLVTYNMFNGTLELLNETMINSYADDLFYTYAMTKGGNHYEYVGKMFFTNMKSFNQISPYSKGHHINVHSLWNNLYVPLITGKPNPTTPITVKTADIVHTSNYGGTYDFIGCKPIKESEPVSTKTVTIPTPIKRIFY